MYINQFYIHYIKKDFKVTANNNSSLLEYSFFRWIEGA